MGKKHINPLLDVINKTMFIINPYNQSGDSDAQAFITAAGITGSTQQSAINALVVGLKSNNLWTKMKAIYPFVGGTATTHKFNLKDPRDLDIAFRLSFSGTITHSANGCLPNGVNGTANTFLNANALNGQSNHISFYSRTNLSTNDILSIGYFVNNKFIQMNLKSSLYTFILGGLANAIGASQTDTRGLFTATRTSNIVFKGFKNATQQGSTNTTDFSSSYDSGNVFLFSRNGGQYFDSKQCAFASIGNGLTDIDVSNLYSLVQAFQTTLNRQV